MNETETKYCNKCGKVLTDDNWYSSSRKKGDYICKKCHNKQMRLRYKKNPDKVRAYNVRWRKANPEKSKASSIRARRKRGVLPMSENKDSGVYLGIYVNERLIRYHFKEIEVMPHNYPGYDFICNKNMKIDAKSSCLNKNGQWKFHIKRNTEADYFLCVAYDNIDDLNIMHVWMIPGEKVNHLKGLTISSSTVHKWDKYIYDIEGFSSCCNAMKNGGE